MNFLTNDFWFGLVTMVSAICWLLLVISPHGIYTKRILHNGSLILAISVIFTFLFFSAGNFDGGFSSLQDVRLMFLNERVLLASWIHILCIDLVLGVWIAEDAARVNFPRMWLSISLVLTFLAGPFGYVFYRFVRAVRGTNSGVS